VWAAHLNTDAALGTLVSSKVNQWTLFVGTLPAWLLFRLFWAQFVLGAAIPASMHDAERVIVGAAYLLLGAVALARDPRRIPTLLRAGFRSSPEELTGGR
jgi:hypothetical protein